MLIAYGESQAGNFALAMAFTGFMSMFPMIVGALAIIGLAIRDPATEAHIQSFVLQAFPPSAQPELQSALSGVEQTAGLLGVISIGGLLWSASSIFSTMEFALTQIFGTRRRDLIRQRLMGLVMMLVLIAAIILSVAVTSLAALVPIAAVGPIVSFIVGAVAMVALLMVLYRFVPNRKFRLREVIPGALLAGVGVELLTLAFPIYARFAGHFNTYGAQFGLFFLLATWFYLLSQLILLGAVFNKFRLRQPQAKGIVPTPTQKTRRQRPSAESMAESTPTQPPRRSVFQRVALGAVVAVAVAAGVVRRRRNRAEA